MSTVVTLPSSAAIETYTGLVAFVVDHLELDSATEAQMPTFVRMAEYRLERLLTVPERETSALLTSTAEVQYLDLPEGYRQLRTLHLLGDTGHPLELVTLTTLHAQYSELTGQPRVYALHGGQVWLGPVPDAAYSMRLFYTALLPALTAGQPTNWLLSQHADAYVYSVMAQAEAFLGNTANAGEYMAMADRVIGEINAQGLRYRNAGPIRLRSPVVV